MFHSFGKYILSFLLIVVFLSCKAADVNTSSDPTALVVENVPFIKQKYRFCGPAALASVMGHYGSDVDQETIASEVYTPELKGSLISDMRHYAEENGYRAKTVNGSLEELVRYIENGQPVILLVDKGKLGLKVQHYYVIYGYNPANSSFIIHDGVKSGRYISSKDLDNEWKKMNRYMLVINNEN